MSQTILIVGVFSLALAGCATTGGGCPPLPAYSAADQKRAARELRTLGKDSPLAAMIVDYKKTRDACAAGVIR